MNFQRDTYIIRRGSFRPFSDKLFIRVNVCLCLIEDHSRYEEDVFNSIANEKSIVIMREYNRE